MNTWLAEKLCERNWSSNRYNNELNLSWPFWHHRSFKLRSTHWSLFQRTVYSWRLTLLTLHQMESESTARCTLAKSLKWWPDIDTTDTWLAEKLCERNWSSNRYNNELNLSWRLDRTCNIIGFPAVFSVDAMVSDESMERSSTVPVNLIGGTLIYCYPGSFPSSVPMDDKWKVAIDDEPHR
jgi:hypothetical protein